MTESETLLLHQYFLIGNTCFIAENLENTSKHDEENKSFVILPLEESTITILVFICPGLCFFGGGGEELI